jgi:hypothetical protein
VRIDSLCLLDTPKPLCPVESRSHPPDWRFIRVVGRDAPGKYGDDAEWYIPSRYYGEIIGSSGVLRDGSLHGEGFAIAATPLGGVVHDQQLLTAVLAAAVTIITSLLAWIGGRRKQAVEADKTQAETQTTVSQGFQLLVSKLQEERKELMRVIDEQSEEITALRSEVRALTRQVTKLENVIVKAGLEVPNAGNA